VRSVGELAEEIAVNAAHSNFIAVGYFMGKTVRVTISFFVMPIQFMITQTAMFAG